MSPTDGSTERWELAQDLGVLVDGHLTEPAYVATLPDGPILILDGVGAAIFRTVADHAGSTADITHRLAFRLGMEPSDLPPHDIANYLQALAEQRVLHRVTVRPVDGEADVDA